MVFTVTRFAGVALCVLATATPCRADSLASSASSAGSASLGSLSNSIRGSSNSSSRDAPVADGDYRIVEIAEITEPPHMFRLKLQSTASPGQRDEFSLDLPPAAFAQARLAPLEVVSVRHRPYGLEFARADTRAAFFLVLQDEWHRELESRAVKL